MINLRQAWRGITGKSSVAYGSSNGNGKLGHRVIRLKFASKCKECRKELPIGTLAAYYGRGRVYGREGCHELRAHASAISVVSENTTNGKETATETSEAVEAKFSELDPTEEDENDRADYDSREDELEPDETSDIELEREPYDPFGLSIEIELSRLWCKRSLSRAAKIAKASRNRRERTFSNEKLLHVQIKILGSKAQIVSSDGYQAFVAGCFIEPAIDSTILVLIKHEDAKAIADLAAKSKNKAIALTINDGFLSVSGRAFERIYIDYPNIQNLIDKARVGKQIEFNRKALLQAINVVGPLSPSENDCVELCISSTVIKTHAQSHESGEANMVIERGSYDAQQLNGDSYALPFDYKRALTALTSMKSESVNLWVKDSESPFMLEDVAKDQIEVIAPIHDIDIKSRIRT